MPLLGRSGLDAFYAVPPSGVAVGLVQSPEPDSSIVTPMHTYAIGNEVPLDPSLSYAARYRWVEINALTLSQVNVVLNPLLKYDDPANVPLNTPPPNWVLRESSQTANDRWKFYPYVHTQDSDIKRFPMSEIHPEGVGTTFNIMFPCGFAFLYSTNPVPSDPQTLYCTLGALTSSVQLNTPYIVEVYYFVHAEPLFRPGQRQRPTYPSSDSWKDRVYVRCTVYGLNSSGQTTETALQADLKHRRTNNARGMMHHLAWDNKSSYLEDFISPVRRWVVSTQVTFTDPSTVKSEIAIRVVGLPGFALLGVLMYPLSEIRASVRRHASEIHPTMCTFNAPLNLAARYGEGGLDTVSSCIPHGIDGPNRAHASVDTSGFAPNEQPPGARYWRVRLYYRTNFENEYMQDLVINLRDVMSKPPGLRYSAGADPEFCSYLTDDVDARPDVGRISYPYSGSYTSVPLLILNNTVKVSYQAPSARQYANWVEFFTDDIPVRPGIMYGLKLTPQLYGDNQRPVGPSSYPYPNNAAPYMRFSYMCFQVAVYGYDKDDNLLETAFLAPFSDWTGSSYDYITDPSNRVIVGPIVKTSLIGKIYYWGMSVTLYYNPIQWGNFARESSRFPSGYPNFTYPFGYLMFRNENVVKARIVIAIVQPYVRRSDTVVFSDELPPGNDTTPYLLVPPPFRYLVIKDVGLCELWPVPYRKGQANFLDEETADFRNYRWSISGNLVRSTSGYDFPGFSGGVGVTASIGESRSGKATIVVPWSHSSEMFVWPCFKMRFRVVRPGGRGQPFPEVRIKLSWHHHDLLVSDSLRHADFDLCPEFFTSGDVTSLGSDYYEVDFPLCKPVYLSEASQPTHLKISIELIGHSGTGVYIGYFNVGFYNDPYGVSKRRVQVPAGIGPKVTINTPFIPPRVVGVEQISRYHWGVRIRPGLAYVRYIIPSYERDHSWLIRAGLRRGDDVVLVYCLPEYSSIYVNGWPCYVRKERVFVRSGVFTVDRPVINHMTIRIVAQGGLSVTGTGYGPGRKFDVDMFGRKVAILAPGMENFTGEAEVSYHYYSSDYLYTGCWYESSSGPVPAPFNLSAFSKTGITAAPFPFQFTSQQYPTLSYSQSFRHGISNAINIILLPSMVIPYDRFSMGDRVGLRLPAHSPAVRSYVRHVFGALGWTYRNNMYHYYVEGETRQEFSVAALRIAYICQIPVLGWACVDLADIRTRGGGVPSGSNVDFPPSYWDMSEWDGGYSTGAGRAIVRLPRSLLQPDRNRDALTHEHIVNLVNQYLPAGIDYEVEYVD